MRTIRTETHIEAPPNLVWQVLTDFARYGEWNPFITALQGELQVGARLRATFVVHGRSPRTFTPRITELEPGRRLVWLGRVGVPKVFDAEHSLAVEPHGDGTRFEHVETFRGVLPPVMGALLADTHRAFIAMDAALALRARSIASSATP